MKIVTLLLSAVVLFITYDASAQMIIGGFEDYDDDDNNDGTEDDWYIYSLEYAVGWHNSPLAGSNPPNYANSCDLIHTFTIANGTPRTGVGCGGFAAVGNGNNEFCYGTTAPLVAGQQYAVSFWIRAFDQTSDNPVIGAVIAQNPAFISWQPQTVSLTPQVTVDNIGETYQEVKYCFTPQNNGVHYMSFGAFLGYGGMSNVYYFIDDVSITAIPQGSPLPIANLTIPQNTYCTGDAVIINGSSFLNETGYSWEVYQLDQGQEALEYSSGPQTGQASTFDVSAVLGFVSPGDCYRVYLHADGLCPNDTFVDFCYVDPDIDFIHDGNPICENTTIPLSVTGDNGWTYSWYEGNSNNGVPFYSGSGSPFKATSVTPTIGNSTYTVGVTTPEGCTFSESISLTVHSQNNLAPWMDGVNGSGDYTFYVSSGVYLPAFTFTSNFYNDNGSEVMDYALTNTNLPSQSVYSVNLPPDDTPNGQMTFAISTGGGFVYDIPPGNYFFTVSATDNNACGNLSSQFTFNIVVGCDHCPVCLNYEDRTPTGTPLPEETKAIDCIEAGLLQTVETGSANVLFQAGNSITLGSNFSAGPNFQALIEPTTCVMDCEDCCVDWGGFTYDPIQNYMNFSDGYPETSFWQLTDIYHPYCAFSAEGYDLVIMNQYQNALHSASYNDSSCCPFQSPSPDNPISHSAIWWDGYTDNIFGNPVHPDDGVYFYLVTLYGCGGATETIQGFITIMSGSRLIQEPSDPSAHLTSEQKLMIAEAEKAEKAEMNRNALASTITLAPNPVVNSLIIQGLDAGSTVQVMDASGRMLSSQIIQGQVIDVSDLASGIYRLRILTDNTYLTNTFVKQ